MIHAAGARGRPLWKKAVPRVGSHACGNAFRVAPRDPGSRGRRGTTEFAPRGPEGERIEEVRMIAYETAKTKDLPTTPPRER